MCVERSASSGAQIDNGSSAQDDLLLVAMRCCVLFAQCFDGKNKFKCARAAHRQFSFGLNVFFKSFVRVLLQKILCTVCKSGACTGFEEIQFVFCIINLHVNVGCKIVPILVELICHFVGSALPFSVFGGVKKVVVDDFNVRLCQSVVITVCIARESFLVLHWHPGCMDPKISLFVEFGGLTRHEDFVGQFKERRSDGADEESCVLRWEKARMCERKGWR